MRSTLSYLRSLSAHVVRRLLLLVAAALLLLPMLALLGAWLPAADGNGQPADILRQMAATVLPGYVWTTLWLALLVGLGVVLVGVATATAVTLFEFPGRRVFEWALLLPLAMPAYVVAYAYTDFLQYSGPLQSTLRALTGQSGRMFPEIRSLGGAAWVFTFSMYPYVYLLTRSALAERAGNLLEAAQLLGAPLSRRIVAVAWPLARPAVAAGAALALMETLADFGVCSYFGIQTFTTGIYKAWLAMDNRVAAVQLATMLLLTVGGLLWLEHAAQRRMRFSHPKMLRGVADASHGSLLRGRPMLLAWCICAAPVLLGFVAPVLFMLHPLMADWPLLQWGRFAEWSFNSFRLAAITALLAVALAMALSLSLRLHNDLWTSATVRLAGLGYAIPGAVVVVGLLLPVGWIQAAAPQSQAASLLTATSLGLLWAYLVRFCAVALQSVQSGYARIPVSFDDSARTLGSGALRVWLRIHWPLLQRSTAAAALLVFVDVMKELPATLVLRPFNSDTLAVVAYQLARDERLGEAALPSLALVLVGLIPVVLLSRTLRSPAA